MPQATTLDQDYNYETAGFDQYMQRSIGGGEETSTAPARSTEIAFDQAQISGALGDTLQIGKIFLNGAEGNIIVSDGENDRILIGAQQDGF